jgi:hypothetical protein
MNESSYKRKAKFAKLLYQYRLRKKHQWKSLKLEGSIAKNSELKCYKIHTKGKCWTLASSFEAMTRTYVFYPKFWTLEPKVAEKVEEVDEDFYEDGGEESDSEENGRNYEREVELYEFSYNCDEEDNEDEKYNFYA